MFQIVLGSKMPAKMEEQEGIWKQNLDFGTSRLKSLKTRERSLFFEKWPKNQYQQGEMRSKWKGNAQNKELFQRKCQVFKEI